MMRLLPAGVKDRLRIAEARRLRKHPGAAPQVTLPPLPDKGSLLVVDDAVDSGRTLRAVLESIAREHPDLRVKSAVVTVTTPRPEAMPDYCMFNDGTLVRFPWSADYDYKEV